jgi:hypothetical protein
MAGLIFQGEGSLARATCMVRVAEPRRAEEIKHPKN